MTSVCVCVCAITYLWKVVQVHTLEEGEGSQVNQKLYKKNK